MHWHCVTDPNDFCRDVGSGKRYEGVEKMIEKYIEQKLVSEVKAAGGICPKLYCPGFDGMPDRLLLMPGGRVAFAEAKAPGQKPRALQVARHMKLELLGFKVFVLDDPGKVEALVKEVMQDEAHTS